MSEWIKCSERLPVMDGTSYLTIRAGYTGPAADRNGTMEIDTAQGQAFWYNFPARGFGATHWMPLPAPPKGVE